MKYNQKIYLLLKAIKNNSNINLLRREGIQFSEISKLIKHCIKDNYIMLDNDDIKLTQNGERYYLQLTDEYKNIFKKDWIEKENRSKTTKNEINFIYLPDKHNLNF